VISDQLDRSAFVRRGYLCSGGVGLVRYDWLASYVNAHPDLGVRHEIYRPWHSWRRYDALLFLKSMGPRSMALLRRARAHDRVTIFDANVNYYELGGREHYQGMLPTERQREQAVAITQAADAVIADSEFIAERCRRYSATVEWITDSVRMDLVPPNRPWTRRDGRIPLVWSGEAVKLLEFLAIEDVLRKYARHLSLIAVSSPLSQLDRLVPEHRRRLAALLETLPHTLLPFQGFPELFHVYGRGAVVPSPRFLDNPYNFGHTEWKLTQAMACGRMALASPVPSYVTIAERSGHRGIRVCRTPEDWDDAFDGLLSGRIDLEAEGAAARAVVERYYATSVVGAQHSAFLRTTIDAGPRPA
jgi:glycosyltransferase involved in cell wall biosynthesis